MFHGCPPKRDLGLKLERDRNGDFVRFWEAGDFKGFIVRVGDGNLCDVKIDAVCIAVVGINHFTAYVDGLYTMDIHGSHGGSPKGLVDTQETLSSALG